MKLKLPEYMIPQVWVELKSLPITINGKIDRKALPDPETKQDEKMEYMAARNDTEAMLIDIWQELLGLDRVGVTDNFFDIGGDSLMAVRIIATIRRKLNNSIELMDLVNYPTIADLVLRIGKYEKDNGS
jgi:acyl carrier protein